MFVNRKMTRLGKATDKMTVSSDGMKSTLVGLTSRSQQKRFLNDYRTFIYAAF